ncbi:MAG: hypothetical protein QOI31_2310 [Solirubrobacterales bacterium]|jgi:hypothetical protein|nr:hypothetical protein [Solirubrobacterales bacterium]
MAARGLGRLTGVAILIVIVALAASPAAAKPPKECPKNTSKEFFANPVVDRVKGLKPTGVSKPAECTFPTLSAALKKANRVEGTVIAKGYKPGKTAVFDKEPAFPLVVGNRTTLTTYDDPDPNRSIKAGHYAVSNFSGSPTLDLGEGSVVHDFTLLDDSKKSADASIVCDQSGVDLADLKLDGKGKKGTRIVTGIEMESECSAKVTNVEIEGFAGDGIVIGGEATLDAVTVEGNGGNGVVVDTTNAVSINNPHFVQNANHGLMVEGTGAASLTVTGDRPTLRSLAEISGNGGDGVHVGDPGATGDIHASISDQDIFENAAAGIEVEDQGARTYEVILLDNDVFTNSGNGALIGPSHIGQSTEDTGTPGTPTFAQNKFHNNTLNQVVFDGGGGSGFTFEIDSPTHQCDAGANAVYSYVAKQVFGIFAQGNANVIVRHTSFEGGGTGLNDFSYQAGSTMSVTNNCTAITITP